MKNPENKGFSETVDNVETVDKTDASMERTTAYNRKNLKKADKYTNENIHINKSFEKGLLCGYCGKL